MAIEQVNVGGPPVDEAGVGRGREAAAPYVDGVALNNSCESSDERGGTPLRDSVSHVRVCRAFLPKISVQGPDAAEGKYLQRSI